jgi:hypothetical protein
MLERYRDGFETFVSTSFGGRGDWAWRIDCRLPPTFDAEGIVTGKATKRDAMIAPQDAIALRRLENGCPAPADFGDTPIARLLHLARPGYTCSHVFTRARRRVKKEIIKKDRGHRATCANGFRIILKVGTFR